MKKKFILLTKLLLMMMLLTNSCKENKNSIIISGIVEDPNHQIRLENVTVNLYSQKIESGAYSSNFQLDETTVTNSRGEFSFSQPLSYTPVFELKFEKDNYFSFSEEFSSEEFTNSEYTNQYEMFPEGYLKLHIKNVYPNFAGDILIYSFPEPELYCNDCCSNSDHKFTGKDIDEYIICKTCGNQDIILNWFVNENGNPSDFSENVFITAFDTTNFLIEY